MRKAIANAHTGQLCQHYLPRGYLSIGLHFYNHDSSRLLNLSVRDCAYYILWVDFEPKLWEEGYHDTKKRAY